MSWFLGVRCDVWVLRCDVWVLRYKVSRVGMRCQGWVLLYKVWCVGFRVQGDSVEREAVRVSEERETAPLTT